MKEAAARAGRQGTSLRDELVATPGMPLSAAELDAAFAPETYLGAADVFVGRALDRYRS